MTTLDVDAVQAFVAIADFQSFTRAAEFLGSTQGAISVKLKRLEDRLGVRLLERTPRQVRLSAQGAASLRARAEFLAAHERALAGLSSTRRRFGLGIAAHVAGPEVPTLLARLYAHDPGLCIEVRLETSRNLLGAFDRGELDAVIIRRDEDRRDGETLGPEHFGWFASPGFARAPGEPLRLQRLRLFAACAISRPVRSTQLASPGWKCSSACRLPSMRQSRRGLPLAPSCRLAPSDTVEVSKRFGLPPLPSSEIVLHSTLTDARSRKALQTLAAAFRERHAASIEADDRSAQKSWPKIELSAS